MTDRMGDTDDDTMVIEFDLTMPEFVVLSGLVGLGIALMQNDQVSGQQHAQNLSQPMIEPVAKRLLERLAATAKTLTHSTQESSNGTGPHA